MTAQVEVFSRIRSDQSSAQADFCADNTLNLISIWATKINRPENLEELKYNIRREIRAINPATLRSVMNNALVCLLRVLLLKGNA